MVGTHFSNSHAVVLVLQLPNRSRRSVGLFNESGKLPVRNRLRLVLEVLRRRQQVFGRVVLWTRLATDPHKDSIPSVVLALRFGVSGNLVPCEQMKELGRC